MIMFHNHETLGKNVICNYRTNFLYRQAFTNNAFAISLGLSSNEIIGTRNADCMNNKDASIIDEMKKRIFDGESIRNEKITITCSKGMAVVLFSATPIIDR